MRLFVCLTLAAALPFVFSSCVVRAPRPPAEPPRGPIVADDWARLDGWEIASDRACEGLLSMPDPDEGLRVDYRLRTDGGWVQMARRLAAPSPAGAPVTFAIRAPEATGTMEIKFVDADGSVFGTKVLLHGQFTNWTRMAVYLDDLDYWWGGNVKFGDLAEFHFAFSGTGQGTVWLDDTGFGTQGLPSSFFVARDASEQELWQNGRYRVARPGPLLDPQRDLPGYGFEQRRAEALIPEDPRVLEWLKILQDVSSPGQQVLPSGENNQLQTFNNSLVAMAFLLKGEKERAERILDFFAARTDRANTDPTLQNFFYNGEARGFFQHAELNAVGNIAAFHHNGEADRWMGDMAWLLFAYKYYEQKHGPDRYREIQGLLKDLIVSWYTDDPNVPGGGYVRHGWRKGDQVLHEPFGHPEGNLDAYAVFELCGEKELARKVKTWLETVITGNGAPLDLYTWRVLAYDGERCELLDLPDQDLRYRKTLIVNGTPVTGPYHSAEIAMNNIWLDGLGHIACAFAACGNMDRARFYANQFDPFLQRSTLGGRDTLCLPYTANKEGGFEFDQSTGIISPAAWYIFAKNGFNPMRLKTTT